MSRRLLHAHRRPANAWDLGHLQIRPTWQHTPNMRSGRPARPRPEIVARQRAPSRPGQGRPAHPAIAPGSSQPSHRASRARSSARGARAAAAAAPAPPRRQAARLPASRRQAAGMQRHCRAQPRQQKDAWLLHREAGRQAPWPAPVAWQRVPWSARQCRVPAPWLLRPAAVRRTPSSRRRERARRRRRRARPHAQGRQAAAPPGHPCGLAAGASGRCARRGARQARTCARCAQRVRTLPGRVLLCAFRHACRQHPGSHQHTVRQPRAGIPAELHAGRLSACVCSCAYVRSARIVSGSTA